jgi:hypothetical protein
MTDHAARVAKARGGSRQGHQFTPTARKFRRARGSRVTAKLVQKTESINETNDASIPVA